MSVGFTPQLHFAAEELKCVSGERRRLGGEFSFDCNSPAGRRCDDTVSLTAREEETLVLLTKGYSNKEIADRLGLSIETVRSHLKHIYKKMHVQSRAGAVARYMSGKPIENG